MSVDPVKFDNPLRRDSLPLKPMTFGFVPRALPLVDGLWASSGFVLIAIYAFIGVCIAMAMLLLANTFGPFVAFVANQQRICIVILAGAVVYRVTNYQSNSFTTILVIATLTGIVQAAVVVTHTDPANGLFLGYLLLLTTWNVAEIAIHYSSINRQLVHLSDVKIQDEYENSLSALTLITIIGSLFYFVFLFGGRGLLGTAIVAFVYAVVAFEKAATKSKKPFRFLFCAINNYLQYPDGADCAPGLIRTNSGKQVHRPACIALLTIGLGCVPIVFYGQSPTIPGLLIWEAISLAYVLTVVTLAAAFSAQRQHFPTTNVPFGSIVNHLRNSENEHENKTYFWGRVVADLSPIIFNRDIAFQHIHILGTTGSGKSALRLAPMIEQTIGFGDMSLIVIDLKADRLESLASCMAAIKDLKQRTGIEMPIKVFTITQGDMSHIFNPFSFVGWTRLSIADKTSIVAEALNLFYGTDWSRGHFSSVNSDIIKACIIANPKIASFRELYQTLCDLAADKSTIIGSQRRENYIHVAQSLQKLASCSVLNGTAKQGCSEFELDERIDLEQAFQVPCVYYFIFPRSPHLTWLNRLQGS